VKHYSLILKEGRKKADLSRRYVAKKAGMSEGHLRFLEKGVRETKPGTLRRLALAIGMNEKPLMESWLKKNMPSMDYHDLAARLPKGIDVAQLEEMYAIEDAKKIFLDIQEITIANFKNLAPQEFFRFRTAFQNCLGFIRELEQAETN